MTGQLRQSSLKYEKLWISDVFLAVELHERPRFCSPRRDQVMLMLSTAKTNPQGGANLDSVVDDLEDMITKYHRC